MNNVAGLGTNPRVQIDREAAAIDSGFAADRMGKSTRLNPDLWQNLKVGLASWCRFGDLCNKVEPKSRFQMRPIGEHTIAIVRIFWDARVCIQFHDGCMPVVSYNNRATRVSRLTNWGQRTSKTGLEDGYISRNTQKIP